MRCSACDHENRPQAKFCAGCGAPLARRCASCSAELPVAARFCDSCGAPVEAVAPAATPARAPGAYTPQHLAEKILTNRSALEGERKQVTVLFADVAGFTALSTRLDPEDLHAVMDGCFRHIMECVHRYEGTVNQFTGDGVMALFGAPIAHEDHAARAVAASSAIQKALAAYGAELQRTRAVEFGLRIGLNTGPVVVGRIGDDLRMDYTAQGETVNLAARVQQAGSPGVVLMSETTARLVRRVFLTEDRGEIVVKGIDHPVRVYALAGERRRQSRFDALLERGLTPFVGRERELVFLEDCLARAREGRGQAVSLVGEAGVGKSRLAYELVRRAESAGVDVRKAECLPHGEAAPFRTVVELLHAILRLDENEAVTSRAETLQAAVAQLDPTLTWAVPYAKLLLALPAPELEAEGLDQAQRKQRTLEAVKALVLRSADERPQLLLVEDVQWIDRSSEEALHGLAGALADRRLLLLCTYRSGYAPPWQDRSFHQRLALEELVAADAARMAETLLPGSESRPLRELVAMRAEGNPLFVEELAGFLREQGPGERNTDAVPQTIHDLLTARIDRLPEGPKRVLQRASVLGREFSQRLLESVSPDGEEVRGALNELVARELLDEKQLFPEVRLSFAQALIRDVAYRGLLLKSRAELHARAGRALESLYAGRLDEVLHDLARHFGESGEPAQALRYRLRAGLRAASVFAYEDAETDLKGALALVDAHAELAGERVEVLDRLGEVAFARGILVAALEHWTRALVAAGASGLRVADLCRKRAAAQWAAGQTDRALADLQSAREALGPELETIEAARVAQELGRIHFRLGDNRSATEWAAQALALGERLGAPDVVSHAYNTLGVAAARAGELERGASMVEKSLETALASDLAAVACRAYANLAVMFTSLDHRRSEQYCREGLELARRIGDQLQQSWLYCALAGGHCTLAGDYDEGVRAAQAAIELDRRLGQQSHLPIPIIILAQIYQCRGDYARSAEHYREALALAESLGEPQLLFPCYDGLATLAIEEGDEAAAEQWLSRSHVVQEAAGWSSDSFLALPFLC
jgi:class 3 adenylate cyclase/predicted ATPase